MLLNTADKVYAGSLLADAVYAGGTKVWPQGAASSAFRDAVLISGPRHFNRCHDLTGEVAVDELGAFPGTYVVPTLDQPGLVPSDPAAKSVLFPSTSRSLNIPSVGSLSAAFGVMLAYRSYGATTNQPLFRDNTSAGGTGTYVNLNGTNVGVGVAANVVVTGVTQAYMENGQPHLILLTRDAADNVACYIDDGVTPVQSRVRAGAVAFTTLYVGKNGTNTASQTRPGYYGEVAVWDKHVTPEQVAAIFEAWAA